MKRLWLDYPLVAPRDETPLWAKVIVFLIGPLVCAVFAYTGHPLPFALNFLIGMGFGVLAGTM